jgi:hypothetical protein
MKNQYRNTVMRDYAHEEKQKFIREVSARTPINQEETLGEKILVSVLFVACLLLLCFL